MIRKEEKKKYIYIYYTSNVKCQKYNSPLLLISPSPKRMPSKLILFSVLAIIGSMLVQCCHGLRLNGGRTLSMKSRDLFSIKPSDVKGDENLSKEYGPFVIDMPLDHFSANGENGTTFKNRYWINTDYYKPNGPILCKFGSCNTFFFFFCYY